MAKRFNKKAYHNEYMRRRYQEDPEFRAKIRARNEINKRRYRAQVDELFLAFRADGCRICPESDPVCLTAHHVDPEQKDFNLGDARRINMSAKKVALELAKCVCLCSNCHAKLHAGHISLVGVNLPTVHPIAQLQLF